MQPSGILFFWYNDGGDYDTNLLTSNLQTYKLHKIVSKIIIVQFLVKLFIKF